MAHSKHYELHTTFISQRINQRASYIMESDERLCVGCKQPFKPFRANHTYCADCNGIRAREAALRMVA